MSFGTESASNILGYVHTIATLVIQYNAVASGGHSTVNTEGCRLVIRYASVIAVEADA